LRLIDSATGINISLGREVGAKHLLEIGQSQTAFARQQKRGQGAVVQLMMVGLQDHPEVNHGIDIGPIGPIPQQGRSGVLRKIGT